MYCLSLVSINVTLLHSMGILIAHFKFFHLNRHFDVNRWIHGHIWRIFFVNLMLIAITDQFILTSPTHPLTHFIHFTHSLTHFTHSLTHFTHNLVHSPQNSHPKTISHKSTNSLIIFQITGQTLRYNWLVFICTQNIIGRKWSRKWHKT